MMDNVILYDTWSELNDLHHKALAVVSCIAEPHCITHERALTHVALDYMEKTRCVLEHMELMLMQLARA